MKTIFVCLANSIKDAGRCIAGVELNGKDCILLNNKPKWIRPTSQTTSHGQIPTPLVENIKLLDIVEIDILKLVPDSYQSENVNFNPATIKKLGTFDKSNLVKLLDNSKSRIFGNAANAISAVDIVNLGYSLSLISVDKFKITSNFNSFAAKTKLRITFDFKSNTYDLPITDPTFINLYLSNKFSPPNKLFLSLSVGTLFNGSHYKLVAGLI